DRAGLAVDRGDLVGVVNLLPRRAVEDGPVANLPVGLAVEVRGPGDGDDVVVALRAHAPWQGGAVLVGVPRALALGRAADGGGQLGDGRLGVAVEGGDAVGHAQEVHVYAVGQLVLEVDDGGDGVGAGVVGAVEIVGAVLTVEQVGVEAGARTVDGEQQV